MPDASVDVDLIRRRFNFDWAMDDDSFEGVDTWWWWARSIRVDPNEIIADDGEGNLWSVSFTTDGEDEVTFGEPTRVRETFVPVQAADGAAATAVVARRRQRVLASALEQPTKPDRGNPAASRPRPTEEVAPVPLDIPALRSRLQLSEEQLPDDATEEQINAVLAADTESEPNEEATETEGEREAEPALAAASTADDTVTLDRSTYEELRTGAQDGRTARAEQVRERRDQLVTAAVNDGRIPPARRDHWLRQLEVDPGAEQVLASLEKGLVPVDERGVAASAAESEAGSTNEGTGWFPKLRKQEA